MNRTNQNQPNGEFRLEDLRIDPRPNGSYGPSVVPYVAPDNSWNSGLGTFMIVLGVAGLGFGALILNPLLVGKGVFFCIYGLIKANSR